MKVILISEECHGLIGVAKDMRSAFQFLLHDRWITEASQIFEPDSNYDTDYHSLEELMKDNKLDNLLDTLLFLWESDEDYFEGPFYFREEDIIEYD